MTIKHYNNIEMLRKKLIFLFIKSLLPYGLSHKYVLHDNPVIF